MGREVEGVEGEEHKQHEMEKKETLMGAVFVVLVKGFQFLRRGSVNCYSYTKGLYERTSSIGFYVVFCT